MPVLNLISRLVISAALFLTSLSGASLSFGFANMSQGGVTFWYGSSDEAVSFTEGSLTLTKLGDVAALPVTESFQELTQSKPFDLIDGVTNFYVDLNGQTLGVSSPGQTIYSWQGANFSALTPGQYQYRYSPSSDPSGNWQTGNASLLSGTVTLAGSLLGPDTPEPLSFGLLGLALVTLGFLRKQRPTKE